MGEPGDQGLPGKPGAVGPAGKAVSEMEAFDILNHDTIKHLTRICTHLKPLQFVTGTRRKPRTKGRGRQARERWICWQTGSKWPEGPKGTSGDVGQPRSELL